MTTGYEIPVVHHRPPRFRVDKGVTLSFETGEMSKEQKMLVLDMDGQLGTLVFIPEEAQHEPLKKIDTTFEGKKPSERLFNTIAVYWRQQGAKGSLDTFYANQIEGIIKKYKDLLDNNI